MQGPSDNIPIPTTEIPQDNQLSSPDPQPNIQPQNQPEQIPNIQQAPILSNQNLQPEPVQNIQSEPVPNVHPEPVPNVQQEPIPNINPQLEQPVIQPQPEITQNEEIENSEENEIEEENHLQHSINETLNISSSAFEKAIANESSVNNLTLSLCICEDGKSLCNCDEPGHPLCLSENDELTACSSNLKHACACLDGKGICACEGLNTEKVEGKIESKKEESINSESQLKEAIKKIEQRNFKEKKLPKRFQRLSNNTEFEGHIKKLYAFTNQLQKITLMNQLIYEKLKTALKTFDSIKKEYGTHDKAEIEKTIKKFLESHNDILKETKITTEEIKKIKREMVDFYKENVESVTETSENSQDLINIKTTLLKNIMKSKDLSKVNDLQLEVLNKIKKMVSDLQGNLIKGDFNKEVVNFYYRIRPYYHLHWHPYYSNSYRHVHYNHYGYSTKTVVHPRHYHWVSLRFMEKQLKKINKKL